ncbi:MAG: hypothetical protein ABJB66_03145 [Gemmatimonadaceae bacterium]
MISARRLSRNVAFRTLAMCLRDLCKFTSFVLALYSLLLGLSTQAAAQTLVITGPLTSTLQTATPTIMLRALNIPVSQRPLRFTVYFTRNSTGDSPFTDTVSVLVNDSTASLLVSKLVPSNVVLYIKARVIQPDGQLYESQILGPYQTPRWLTLIGPDSGKGNPRKPTFRWSSAKVDASFGVWKYDLQILTQPPNGPPRVELATSGLTDTIFVPNDELRANTPYKWQVHASLAHGEEVTENSISSFVITDPTLPTTTLLYQNFPNPFPSVRSFTTCFWFDIGAAGGVVSLDVLDFRGNLVRRIIDPQQTTNAQGIFFAQPFLPGSYGRGAFGAQNGCDNRFVWDGTATDGRTVPRGIYFLRLLVAGSAPSFKKIVFLGR